jgi:hypothetical protein
MNSLKGMNEIRLIFYTNKTPNRSYSYAWPFRPGLCRLCDKFFYWQTIVDDMKFSRPARIVGSKLKQSLV